MSIPQGDLQDNRQQGSLELTSHSREETARIGAMLGLLLRGGDVVCLSGDLGAGKTALTAGIARGWKADQPVNSPTFVFVHEHTRAVDAMRLYHLDCYRLSSEEDAISIGLEDILNGQDVAILEWPERVKMLLPADYLWIDLDNPDPDSDPSLRILTLTANGARYHQLVEQLGAQISYGQI